MHSILKRYFTKYTETIKNSTWAILQESEQKKKHTGDTRPCSHSAVHKNFSELNHILPSQGNHDSGGTEPMHSCQIFEMTTEKKSINSPRTKLSF